MAPVSHGTSACTSSAFAPPTANKISAMGAMMPAYFSMTVTYGLCVLSRCNAASRNAVLPRSSGIWTFCSRERKVPIENTCFRDLLFQGTFRELTFCSTVMSETFQSVDQKRDPVILMHVSCCSTVQPCLHGGGVKLIS